MSKGGNIELLHLYLFSISWSETRTQYRSIPVGRCSKDVDDNGGGEIYMVHLSAWGHTRDASLSVKAADVGLGGVF